MDKDTITSIVFLAIAPILAILLMFYVEKKSKTLSNNTEVKIPHRNPMNTIAPTFDPMNPNTKSPVNPMNPDSNPTINRMNPTKSNISFLTISAVSFLNRKTKHVAYTKKEKIASAIFMILFLYSIPMCAWPAYPFSPWHDELKALEPVISSNVGYIIIAIICGFLIFVLMLIITFIVVSIITALIMRSYMSKEEAKTFFQKMPPPQSGIDKIDLPIQKLDLFIKNRFYLQLLKIIWLQV